ncbi:uncharacterized protein CDAR_546951 [Caerostris darwini]|uniref:Uncharacterized protein n=1 Tax=Caerostris darwini TaxID=1538125 RepID=A0AAV4SYI9_9ARAC|nr:uncharacterized protein CDAR_546951 [Caerostris darwini]
MENSRGIRERQGHPWVSARSSNLGGKGGTCSLTPPGGYAHHPLIFQPTRCAALIPSLSLFAFHSTVPKGRPRDADCRAAGVGYLSSDSWR